MFEAERITHDLNGKWYGRYGVARCPAHEDLRPSLTLKSAEDGKLLAHCKAGCAFPDVLNALRGLGISAGSAQFTPLSEEAQARNLAKRNAEAAKREIQASAVWKDAVPIHGTPAEIYLRSRGISCALPNTLRYHPSCWNPGATRLPALIARVEGATRLAVHRTYLALDGSGKALVAPNKAMLGSVTGGAVRLIDAKGPLVVAEGIETALSLASGLLCRPATIWAALSASGIAGLVLPPIPSRLTIATDGDEPGRKAGYALAEKATAMGWRVSLLPAPEGQDWNDILCRKGVK